MPKTKMQVRDLTAEHIGHKVLGVKGIAGWEDHLVLRDIEHRDDGTYLGFRWNDDPTPANSRRGTFATGCLVDHDDIVWVVIP